MPDIKHDPELPFAFISTANREVARFADREIAARFGKEVMVGKVVDTTPKPKIPEDAQHITWGTETIAYSRYNNDLWYGWNHGYGLSDEELLGMIGDAEVTVLVRKEEP